jgi:hypothetical protein
MASVSRKSLDWVMLVTGDVTVPAVISWEHHAGEATSKVALLIGFFSLVILNVLILRAILSRRKRLGEGTSRGFVLGAVGLALLAGLLTTVGLVLFPERNEYVELAFSNVPLSEIHPEQKALVVEFARRRAANSKNYEQVAAQMMPISPALYSPDSFGGEAVIRSTSESYEKANAVDFAYHEQQEQALSDFRAKMMKVDPDYLKSFDAGLQEQEAREAKSIQLQKECLTATLALYDYADTHIRDIAVENGQLRFANDSVRTEFSRQLAKSKSSYEQWQETVQENARIHQRSRKEVGLAPSP